MLPHILIFIDWYLPGTNAGGPVRSVANLIDHLSGEYDFSIITGNIDYCAPAPYPDIVPDNWIPVNGNCRVCYLSAGNTNRKTLQRLIRETPFDVAWINGIYSWKFSILPLLLLRGRGKRIVVSPRGMLNPQAFTSKNLKKLLFIALARWTGLYHGVDFHATNEDERAQIIQRLGKETRVTVAPNLPRRVKSEESKVKSEEWRDEGERERGSDLSDLNELSPESRALSSMHSVKSEIDNPKSEIQKTPGILNLVSVARISPEKGTIHALRFLKKINMGTIRFDLYGPVYDKVYWQDCLHMISELPGNITVAWHGPVEGDKVREVLAPAHFLLMPTEGENFGHTILEALSAGCPVIISDRTPWKDLTSRKAGFDLPLEEASGFVKALEKAVSMDNETFQQWSRGASQLAQEYTGNPANVEASRQLFSEK